MVGHSKCAVDDKSKNYIFICPEAATLLFFFDNWTLFSTISHYFRSKNGLPASMNNAQHTRSYENYWPSIMRIEKMEIHQLVQISRSRALVLYIDVTGLSYHLVH
jgi:hypothetical protein